MEIDGIDIFGFLCVFFILSYLLYIVYYAIGLYELNPFNRPKPLTQREEHLLRSRFTAIERLDDATKIKFYKRVAWFRAKKPFSFRGPVANKNEIKLLISSAGVLLTSRMNHYKFVGSIHRVVVYPSDYYSILNKRHHVGEYNVGLKTLVFAADTLKKGFEDDTDNLNLAIHEFAHALCFETHNKNSWEALRFQWGFKKLNTIYEDPVEKEKIKESGYFRSYGSRNVFEFFSVVVEHYVETPELLQANFPKLHEVVGKMLNLRF